MHDARDAAITGMKNQATGAHRSPVWPCAECHSLIDSSQSQHVAAESTADHRRGDHMSLGEAILLGVVLGGFLLQAGQVHHLTRVLRQMNVRITVLEQSITARQTQIKQARQFGSSPRVERARTTRRDSDDIPGTARQSRIARRPEGGDPLGIDHHGRLQQDPRSPTA